MFSPDCTVIPNQMPFSNLSSKSPTLFAVFGTLNRTASPNATNGRCVFCPLILVNAVRPHGITWQRVKT
jgi:hypothetical protein